MLKIDRLRVTMEGRVLLEDASATVPAGKRVGVVGRNGAGKTTLFRVIMGELGADGGAVETPRGWRIGAVAQEAPGGPETLIEVVLAADVERAALLAEAERALDPDRIAEIQTRLADISAHSAEARAASILAGLGFDAAAQARACAEFSGGWRMRVALAAALFAAPDLLLLDEPTNYLDVEGAIWLEGFLARYPHTILAISHDRGLLSTAMDAILYLADQKLEYFPVAYERFDQQRRARALAQMSAKVRQDAERARITAFVDRFRAKASKARQAQARLKMLERMTPIAAVVESKTAPLEFPTPSPLEPPILRFEDVALGYAGRTVLRGIDLRIDQDDRIALLGANGQGKSTLSKAIAGRLAPLSGRLARHPKLSIGYFAQHQLDELVETDTATAHMRRRRPDETEPKLRARLGSVGLTQEVAETPVGKLSGGQKARLLLALAALDAPHLLILDEPTNHLDIESREALAQALAGYGGAVILVSHDAHLVESVADRLLLVEDGRVGEFDGDVAAYRARVLAERGRRPEGEGAERAAAEDARRAKRRDEAERRRALGPLRSELARAEERVAKLEAMRATIEARLADPELYAGPAATLEPLGRKRAEILDGLARAEALWLEAAAALEAAERAERAET